MANRGALYTSKWPACALDFDSPVATRALAPFFKNGVQSYSKYHQEKTRNHADRPMKPARIDSDKDSDDGWLNSTVLGAGLTSALGDFNYETCNVILPGFLAVLGIPAAALGAMEGIADGISSLAKLGAGYIADKLGHRKTLVVLGYGLTAIMPVLFAVSGGWALILVGRIVGWFGKGIRGPLRDAILSESITPASKGKAFGFHRAADTAGAVIGPLLGVAVLAGAQKFHPTDGAQPFRTVFWLALIPGILSVISFALLVKDDGSVANPMMRFWSTLRDLPSRFRQYLRAVGIFGIGDFAHTLLILAATQILTPSMGVTHAAMVAGLLYVWRNAVQTLVSFPIGALADRFGHRRLLVIGYGVGVCVAALTACVFAIHHNSLLLLTAIFTLAGLYVAVEEALEASLTAEYVPATVRGTSYGLLASVNGVGDLISSAVVGFVWTAISPVVAFGCAAVVMGIGTLSLARIRD